MSGYPYGADERYPDDALHTSYLAIWNTRIRGAASAGGGSESSATPIRMAEYHTSAWIPVVENEFSVDSDQFVAVIEFNNGSVTTMTVSAGWESESSETVQPTPSAPGTAVGASSIASMTLDDGSYWRTNLATADTRWNWQVMKFDLSGVVLADVRGITFAWNGHGEPTVGYPTSVSFWSPVTNAWVQVTRTMMGTDTNVTKSQTRLDVAFCLRCHDGTPPSGVVVPADVTNIGATWNTTDYHGAGTGNSGTALKPPYSRGQAAIGCPTCHDTHGTGNLYHVPSIVNGQAVPTIAASSDMDNLCRTCHAGTASDWHIGPCGCHYDWGPGDDHQPSMLPDENMDCLSCHQGHVTVFNHSECSGCH